MCITGKIDTDHRKFQANDLWLVYFDMPLRRNQYTTFFPNVPHKFGRKIPFISIGGPCLP
jgi:hypothetical protein